MTKREALTLIKELLADNKDIVAYAENEIALLDKKNVYRKEHPAKPTKRQEEAAALIAPVLEVLDPENGKSSKDIAEALGLPTYQKLTPILTKLVADGKATAEKVKGKNLYFKVVE